MGKSSINGPFSMAMLNNQRVYQIFSEATMSSIAAAKSPAKAPAYASAAAASSSSWITMASSAAKSRPAKQ